MTQISTPKREPERTHDPDQVERGKALEEKYQDEAVEESFPASDPPATTQPNSGITGPEVASEK